MSNINVDELEVVCGTAILSALTGQQLTRNQQPVRLFDQTRNTAEFYFRSDKQGKPYIQDFQQGKRYYPITAFCQFYGVDYVTALTEISQQYSLDNKIFTLKPTALQVENALLTPVSIDYIPIQTYHHCQKRFERNGLYCYLKGYFDESTALRLFKQYRLGTSRRWLYYNTFGTCLPQFDKVGNLRQVKIIPFHPESGKRAKRKDNAYKWKSETHTYELDEEEKVWFAGRSLALVKSPYLKQCYFGEHLLTLFPEKTVALVEGESTAIVCSAIWSDYVWLATGGSTGCKWSAPDVFEVLRDRDIVLWPDTGKYQEWQQKAKPLKQVARKLKVSQYVEDAVPKGASNVDLRDLLTWPRYTPKNGKPIFGQIIPTNNFDTYPEEWDSP